MTHAHECRSLSGRVAKICSPRSPASRRASGSRNSASGRSVSRARYTAAQFAVSEMLRMAGSFRLIGSPHARSQGGGVDPSRPGEVICQVSTLPRPPSLPHVLPVTDLPLGHPGDGRVQSTLTRLFAFGFDHPVHVFPLVRGAELLEGRQGLPVPP